MNCAKFVGTFWSKMSTRSIKGQELNTELRISDWCFFYLGFDQFWMVLRYFYFGMPPYWVNFAFKAFLQHPTEFSLMLVLFLVFLSFFYTSFLSFIFFFLFLKFKVLLRTTCCEKKKFNYRSFAKNSLAFSLISLFFFISISIMILSVLTWLFAVM